MLIQITPDNDDNLQTPITFGGGDTIEVDAGAVVNAPGDGIIGPDGATLTKMNIFGSIQAGGSAIVTQSGLHHITVDTGGSLSAGSHGIWLNTGSDLNEENSVSNKGAITTAAGVDAVGIRAASSYNFIQNSGSISSDTGISAGKFDPSSNSVVSLENSVYNVGTISATLAAVVLLGDKSLLDNDGSLTGEVAVQLHGTHAGTIKVKNSGIIQGTGGTAISGQVEKDQVYNSGTIIGSVALRDGNDFYSGSTGTITGSIDLGAGDDAGYAGTGAESLDGGDGSDTLDGGMGDDTLNGSNGIDTAEFSGTVGATVDLNIATAQNTSHGMDLLIGIENLFGGAGDDWFIGDANANTLAGWDGNDTLNGGDGFDTAIFDDVIDITVDLNLAGPQNTGHGMDEIISIENLTGGEGADKFIGDGNANVLLGNSGSDTLGGGLGDDTLLGGIGIDTALFTGASAAMVNLTINAAQNTGYGMDILSGIENLTGGTGADSFRGDGNDNRLAGMEGNDTLDGGLGNDILDGGDGIDTVTFSGLAGATVNLAVQTQATNHGTDTFIGIENLTGGAGADNFMGNSAANRLLGGSGSDLLNGGLGNDTLDGGSGLDVLRFTGSAKAVVNLALKTAQNTGYGKDTILGIEALWGGIGSDRFTGNSANNAFIGEAGRDTISGGSGQDTLSGGLGNDSLTGGSGKDLFVFDTKLSSSANLDTIADFRRVDDTLRLENAIFKKLTKTGTLNKSYLALGSKAKDKNDYIVYDKTKGYLSYDADGSGSGKAVLFAKITKGLSIDYKDFYVI